MDEKRQVVLQVQGAMEIAAAEAVGGYNDTVTRTASHAFVDAPLKLLKENKQIADYLVVCDGTNNDPAVVDSNQLVMDAYIRFNDGAWTQLNAVVYDKVTFTEIRGIDGSV